MKAVTTFAFVAETVLASVALGALWLAPMSMLVKISITCVLFFGALTADVHGLQRSSYVELQAELLELSFRFLEAKLEGTQETPLSALYSEFAKQQGFKQLASGSGIAHVWTLLGRYSIWLAGGYVNMYFLLPPLIATTAQWQR